MHMLLRSRCCCCCPCWWRCRLAACVPAALTPPTRPTTLGIVSIRSHTRLCTRAVSPPARPPTHPPPSTPTRITPGGGFGGKESRAGFINAAAAIPAYHLGRPVRICIDRWVGVLSRGRVGLPRRACGQQRQAGQQCFEGAPQALFSAHRPCPHPTLLLPRFASAPQALFSAHLPCSYPNLLLPKCLQGRGHGHHWPPPRLPGQVQGACMIIGWLVALRFCVPCCDWGTSCFAISCMLWLCWYPALLAARAAFPPAL